LLSFQHTSCQFFLSQNYTIVKQSARATAGIRQSSLIRIDKELIFVAQKVMIDITQIPAYIFLYWFLKNIEVKKTGD